ncbi:hypothetical protein N8499_03405 [Akkermansiaceae bacterium]|nr:hypothetical protein [Akkermansiaceae bacterium]
MILRATASRKPDSPDSLPKSQSGFSETPNITEVPTESNSRSKLTSQKSQLQGHPKENRPLVTNTTENLQCIRFVGTRKYWNDSLEKFDVTFQLGKFLKKYPAFTEIFNSKNIISAREKFDQSGNELDNSTDPEIELTILYYLNDLLTSLHQGEDLLIEFEDITQAPKETYAMFFNSSLTPRAGTFDEYDFWEIETISEV